MWCPPTRSKTNPAKILVVMIKDKGKPGSRMVNQ